jgi:hypothetical protein
VVAVIADWSVVKTLPVSVVKMLPASVVTLLAIRSGSATWSSIAWRKLVKVPMRY